MRARWKLALAALATVALLASGCGGDDDDSTDTAAESTTTSTTAAEEETTTTTAAEGEEEGEEVVRADADLVIWADDTRTPVITPFAEQFGEENDLSVAVQELGFDDIRDRLTVAGPAGEGPDIIIGAHDWLGQLVSSGVVSPIDLGATAEEFNPVAIDAFTYGGQLYGLPYAVENVALLRNTDLVPEAPATFEELAQTALDLKASGQVDVPLAIQEDPGDPFHNYPLFTALGGYVFGRDAEGNYDPTDLGIDSEGGLAAAQAFADWAQQGLISSETSYDVMIEAFGSGRAPFAITGPWAISQEETGFAATGVPYVVEPIPPVAGGEPRPFVGVQGFMVSAQAENPLAAQTFLVDFMATEDAQVALFEAGGRPPALTAAFEQVADDPDIAGFQAAGANGEPLPAIPEMGSVWSAWTDAYQLVLTNQGDPAQAFTDAADQIRTLIEEGE
jgi:arabinogalactan oligomer / maltooligosaccharide transport system substrate-binding protein